MECGERNLKETLFVRVSEQHDHFILETYSEFDLTHPLCLTVA